MFYYATGAFSMSSTILHLFNLDKGLVAKILTLSPTEHRFFHHVHEQLFYDGSLFYKAGEVFYIRKQL